MVNTIDPSKAYRDYISCLNEQDWPALENFVHEDVRYNEQRIGISGYRDMLARDFEQIPDLHFNIQFLIVDSSFIACRLCFDCTPKSTFLGLPINGKKVQFTENVFYQFLEGKITNVWSVVDKAAIEAQLL